MDLDSFSFLYQNVEYKAIVRTKTIEKATEYHITIMNGDLEKMLYGHHILVENFGAVIFKKEGSETISELQRCISSALQNYLKSVSFA